MINLIIENYFGMVPTLLSWWPFLNQAFVLCHIQVVEWVKGSISHRKMAKAVVMVSSSTSSAFHRWKTCFLSCVSVGVTQDQGKQIGIMFLVRIEWKRRRRNCWISFFSSEKNEVALGKEHGITRDDSSLKKPPSNFDSVVARGQTEPGR